MTVSLAQDAIDLGIVTTCSKAMISFYQDLLGFEFHSQSERDGTTITRTREASLC